MFAKVLTATPQGVGALFVTVEVDRRQSAHPGLAIVGLPDAAVRESKERVLAALRRIGPPPEPANVVVNLAPAEERKEGAGLDLAIAVGLLATRGVVPSDSVGGTLLLGELSLEGRLLPVRGVLPIALAARDRGIARIVLPAGNATEAAVVEGVEVLLARTLAELVLHLRGERLLPPAEPRPVGRHHLPAGPDLVDVIGQEQARRALEIAAAGGHHTLLIGPPGSGKSMLARRLPGILPPLEHHEALETTSVHSVSRRVPRPDGLLSVRPFRAPHHTVSAAALIGGGTNPQPGEISLAHNGVLFLDELTEFRRDVLESLRQPLEDRRVTISRARRSLTFPARFQLIAAANPCPCGFLGDSQRSCRCTPRQIERYRARLSGPLLDRIDLQVQVPAVPWRELGAHRRGEPSAAVAGRVRAARERQRSRFGPDGPLCNAELGPAEIATWCEPPEEAAALLERAARTLGLTARAYHRILRVARTIADLEGAETLAVHHVAEAVAYRVLDRGRESAPAAAVQ